MNEPITLVMTRAVIARCVPPRAYLNAVRTAFTQLGQGDAECCPVAHFAGLEGTFHIKMAVGRVSPRRGVVKINGNFPCNPVRHALPLIQGLIALVDAERGSILALMDSTEITARRTAATSALAAQLLARPQSRRLAFIGCGVQARHHLDSLSELFPLESVSLHDCAPEHAEALAQAVASRGLVAEILSTVAAAARNADIVVTTTPSRTSLLDSSHVSDGCFIAAVGADSPAKQELAPALLRRARIVPDILAQAADMGDLHHAIAAGIVTADEIHGELADVVLGRRPARTSEAEIFVFDSTGSATADLAAAEMAYAAVYDDPSVLRVRLSG